MVWCGVVWCGVVWCGVVWCGVVWCGVVWCDIMECVMCDTYFPSMLQETPVMRQCPPLDQLRCRCSHLASRLQKGFKTGKVF